MIVTKKEEKERCETSLKHPRAAAAAAATTDFLPAGRLQTLRIISSVKQADQ